mmetsp:Transcript_33238/g.73506  ORF Transcript_33238/g.73506 Transcript_33238/m.73506 type:complete len:629 (+) Transcript_33238:92-1978(+)
MMRHAVFSAKRSQEFPAVAVAQVRQFFAVPKVDFAEDVSTLKLSAKDAPSVLEDWSSKKAGTEDLLKLLQTYKDLGDSKNEPYLKFHNPRSFEDLSKPIPNFRAMNLKAGEVPKFFDSVLSKRADDSVQQKNQWWATRKQEAESAIKGKAFQPFATVPIPEWNYGKSVSLDSLKTVTDKYIRTLEPKRKLKLPVLPAQVKDSLAAFTKSLKQDKSLTEVQEMLVKALADKAVVEENGKVLDGFQYVSRAVAAKALAQRRAEVHERYLKFWAKKVLVAPEQAVVPLKEVDYQLASKFEGVSPQYSELLSAVAAGPKTLGERIAESPAFSTFLLKREAEAVKGDFPASDVEKEGAALAAKLEDPQAALEHLLGPEVKALGTAGVPLSAQVRAITQHKYSPDRYQYKEGLKLAAKLEEEEAALKAELQGAYGENVDVAHFQAHPRTPVQQLVDRQREVAARAAEFEAEKSAASNAYAAYAVAKKQEFLKDASNLAFEEVLYPELVQEALDIELAELREAELAIDDAEEEELWALTLSAQLKHLQKHFGVDLPHGVLAYMDPLLVKKIDWETTNGLDDWDSVLEDVGSEYAKEQWGVESLSHHFLPLIRYRRAKARRTAGRFEAELASHVRH